MTSSSIRRTQDSPRILQRALRANGESDSHSEREFTSSNSHSIENYTALYYVIAEIRTLPNKIVEMLRIR